MHTSQYLEDASICTATTNDRKYISDTEEIASESVDADYATALYDDSAIDEILMAGDT